MPKMLDEKLARARQLLAEIHHVAVATVNEDGPPHNSPVFMAFDGQLEGFWPSSPASLHSRNIARAGKAFLAVFDSREGHGGLFIEAAAEPLEGEAEAQQGLGVLRKAKEQMYGAMGGLEMYVGAGPQRIYRAKPLRFWVNVSDHDEQGTIIRDVRAEIRLEDMINLKEAA